MFITRFATFYSTPRSVPYPNVPEYVERVDERFMYVKVLINVNLEQLLIKLKR